MVISVVVKIERIKNMMKTMKTMMTMVTMMTMMTMILQWSTPGHTYPPIGEYGLCMCEVGNYPAQMDGGALLGECTCLWWP